MKFALLLFCSALLAPAQDLVGRWTNGRISTIQYKDIYTGVYKPPSGSHFAYEFKSDGTYMFVGLMQRTVYNCTNAVFSQETGTYEFANGSVMLHPRSNPYRMTNSCAPSSNREAPGQLVERTYRVRIDGRNLELGEGSSLQTFIREESGR